MFLLSSLPNSAFHLCLDNFAMSPARFILPREPCQCWVTVPLGQSLSNKFCGWEVVIWCWTLELACRIALFACAVAMCFRGLLVPVWTWISRLVEGKRRLWDSKRGNLGYCKAQEVFQQQRSCTWGKEAFSLSIWNVSQLDNFPHSSVCKSYCSCRDCILV